MLDRTASALLDIGRELAGFIFPSVCPLCSEPVHSTDRGFCQSCASLLKPLAKPFCNICGRPFDSENTAEHECGECILEPPPFSTARAWGRYTLALAEAIKQYKFKGRLNLRRPLFTLLLECYDRNESLLKSDLIIPVPLHRERLRERGYNQSLLLAKLLAKARGMKLSEMNLRRIRYTMPQIGLSPAERKKNVRGAFELADSVQVKDRSVLLIDDVYTSGATARECSRILKKAKAREVRILSLARA